MPRQDITQDPNVLANLEKMVNPEGAPAAQAPTPEAPAAEAAPVETPAEEPAKQETPAAEAPQEEPAETAPKEVEEPVTEPQQEHQPKETPSSTDALEFTEEQTEDLLYDLTGGKVDSAQKLMELIESAESAVAPQTHQSDLINQMIELEKQGVNVTPEVMAELTFDYTSLDHTDHSVATDLIMRKLKSETPDLTDAELKYEMKQYHIDKDEMEEDEIEMRQMKALREGRKAKAYFEDRKSKLIVPTLQPKEDPAIAQAQQEEYRKKFDTDVRSASRAFNEVKFDIGGDSHKYEITKDDQRTLREAAKSVDGLLGSFFDKGELKGDKLMEFLAWNDPDIRSKMIASVKGQAKSTATKEVVSKLKNSSNPTQTLEGEGSRKLSAIEQARQQQQARQGKKRGILR